MKTHLEKWKEEIIEGKKISTYVKRKRSIWEVLLNYLRYKK